MRVFLMLVLSSFHFPSAVHQKKASRPAATIMRDEAIIIIINSAFVCRCLRRPPMVACDSLDVALHAAGARSGRW